MPVDLSFRSLGAAEAMLAFERQSLTDLASSSADLDNILRQRYRGEHLAREFNDGQLRICRLIESGA